MLQTHDLTDIVYTSGAVFNGLTTGRMDTHRFLATGSTAGVTTKPDLMLLKDLRDVAEFVVRHPDATVDADYVVAINTLISRTGSVDPGKLRTNDQGIGVRTKYGRHEPPAVTHGGLQDLVVSATSGTKDDVDAAIALFIRLAATQPFGDGNKRTALFAANGLLITRGTGKLLSLPDPRSDQEPDPVAAFNDLLSRAYIHADIDPLRAFLRHYVIDAPGRAGTVG